MKRRRRKRKWNVVKIFVTMALAFVCIGFIITLRIRHENSDIGISSAAFHTDFDSKEERIQKIIKNKKYPSELREALKKNSEMLDFVEGYKKASKDGIGSFSNKEKRGEHPLLLQWDKRWGYAGYGGSMIGISGCGPTCLSMVVVGLTHKEVTPYEVADYAEKNGYYVDGSGTSWGLMTEGARHFGIEGRALSLSEEKMKELLDLGGMCICAMRPGDFTTEGHFIVIYGYNEQGFQVNDPNSVIRSKKCWPYSRISHQIKNLWGYTTGG